MLSLNLKLVKHLTKPAYCFVKSKLIEQRSRAQQIKVDRTKIASMKKSAEIRRNTQAKTPSNTQKRPSKNTPSKNTRFYKKKGRVNQCFHSSFQA
ncbi:hypothetical protein C6496_02495 [Candidatus Poribacteria bacterium]|nr:MAG: hypothetical protein C6496_02495 [Candidatus Poribacteria bacterium]